MASHRRQPPTVRVDGDRIRSIRESKGLTQLYVAEVVQVSVDTVSRWENKRTAAVKRDNAEALARALEVDLEEVLESEQAGETGPEFGPPDKGSKTKKSVALAALVLVAVLAAWFLWRYALTSPLVVEGVRRLPSYTPVGSDVPVLVTVRVVSGEGPRVILRETLPPGWRLVGAVPRPDQGPTEDGLAKWILPIEKGNAQVAYLVRTPSGARESTAHRFSGEIVTSGREARKYPVKGQSRIDLEYIHWADEDGDFQISDSEVLDALERLEAVRELGLDPSDLRTLWGAPEYEWDRGAGRFQPVGR